MKTTLFPFRLLQLPILFFAIFCQTQQGYSQPCCNILTNGDFEQVGGFSSGLPQNCACASNSYCVGANFQVKCVFWPPLLGNGGSGNFLIIDGNPNSPADVWRSSVTLSQAGTYCFSFFAASVYDVPFDLGITVNGTLVPNGTFTISQSSPFWTYYTTSITLSPGTYTLAIRQLMGGAFQDFGIDDVVFGIPVVPDFASTPDLACGLKVSFFNQSSGPAPLTYSWSFGDPASGPANVSTQQNPTHTFTACGDYEVCLTATRGSCTEITCKIISVTDDEAPKITCPASISITAAPPNCATVVNAIKWLSATDNCGTPMVDYQITGSSSNSGQNDASGSMFNPGISTVIYTATDACDNTASCSFSVTVACDYICPNSIAQNPGFFQGAIPGDLGSGGVSNNWIRGSGSPQVITGDQCWDPVAIQMWGRQNQGESFCQGFNFLAGHTYSIRFCARFVHIDTLATNYIRFGFTAMNNCSDPFLCNPGICEDMGSSGQITSQGWANISLPNWTPTQNWSFFNVRAFTNTNIGDSFGRIDNICIEDITPACACPGGTQGGNLITNSDFTLGDNGFDSDLINPNNTCGSGRYGVTNNFNVFCGSWPALGGRPGPNGNFLQLDGNNNIAVPTILYASAVSLTANQSYCFSFWWAAAFGTGAQNFPVEITLRTFPGNVVVQTITPQIQIAQAVFPIWTQSIINFTSNVPTGTYYLAISQLSGALTRDWGIDDLCLQETTPPCTADFTFTPLGGCGKYQFTNTSSAPGTLSAMWDFGDGNTSTQTSPMHQFSTCGTYTVCLTITGANGCMSTICKTLGIIDNVPPMAKCNPGTGVTLNANCQFPVTTSFVDGGTTDNCLLTSVTVSPTVLTGCQNHTVTLTATDWCGNTSTCTMGIQTLELVPPTINCPQNMTILGAFNPQGICTGVLPPLNVTYSDNCDPNPVLSNNAPPGAVLQNGPNTILYTATDQCGNSKTCSVTVTVVCEPLVCKCSAGSGAPGLNLVQNGTFSAGNVNFTSDLAFPVCGCGANTCCVLQQFTDKCANWPANFFDHTYGSGTPALSQFLIVDGNPAATTNVWEQSVTLAAGATYEFSFWTASVHPPAFQNFTIQAQLVDALGAPLPGGTLGSSMVNSQSWVNHCYTWLCPPNLGGTQTITIRHLGGGAFRDFGIDDICLRQTAPPCTVALTFQPVNNACRKYQFNATATGTAPFTYSWNFGDNTAPVGGSNPMHQYANPGTYTVTVTVIDAAGCPATQTATITTAPGPTANAGPDQTMCAGQTATLSASVTGGIPPYAYNWFPWWPNNPYTVSPSSDQTYVVIVTDADGCTSSDQADVDVINCCQSSLVDNWDFSQGATPLGIDFIWTANGWGGIWPPGPGDNRNGDFWGPSGVPAPFGPLPWPCFGVVPSPPSGNYAGYVNAYALGSVGKIHRQGILNNLNGSINPNTGWYKITMQIACPCLELGTSKMDIWGVPISAIYSTPSICPPPVTNGPFSFYPTNSGLFTLSAVPCPYINPAVEFLDDIIVPNSMCNSTWRTFTGTFNSATLGLPIDRIFMTRKGGIAGSTYLAVDDVCIEKIADPNGGVCDCGPIPTGVISQQGGTPRAISCGASVQLPCNSSGNAITLTGSFACNTSGCADANNTVSWVLNGPGGPYTGTSTGWPGYPTFSISFPGSYFPTSGGAYTLTLTRICGTKVCRCDMKFTVAPCPCICDNRFYAAVNQGFITVGPYSVANCSRNLKPVALCPNDVVSWILSSGGPFGPSTGNNVQSITFPGPGSYQVCMLVKRTLPNGIECIAEKCQTINVSCGIDPTGNWYKLCKPSIVKNGDFRDTAVIAGIMGVNGWMPEWDIAPNYGDGQVFVEDSIGADDEGHMILIGGENNFAGITQEISLNPDTILYIAYSVKNYLGDESPAGTRIEVRLQEYPFPGSTFQILHKQELDPSGGWERKEITVQMSPDITLKYLVICAQNDDPDQRSVIGIDNFELCNSDDVVSTSQVEDIPRFRLFPNPSPGYFTVELPQPATAGMIFRITDLAGRLLLETEAEAGTKQHYINASSIPNGLYFLQLMSEGRVLGLEKMIKQ